MYLCPSQGLERCLGWAGPSKCMAGGQGKWVLRQLCSPPCPASRVPACLNPGCDSRFSLESCMGQGGSELNPHLEQLGVGSAQPGWCAHLPHPHPPHQFLILTYFLIKSEVGSPPHHELDMWLWAGYWTILSPSFPRTPPSVLYSQHQEARGKSWSSPSMYISPSSSSPPLSRFLKGVIIQHHN